MILTDGEHLVSTVSLGELHHFAQRIKLKREWLQDHPKHPHYDLTTKRAAERAISAGAKLVSSKELLRWAKGGETG